MTLATSPSKSPRSAGARNVDPPQPAWERGTLRDLVRHIVDRHHGWLRAELPEIGGLIRRGIESGGRERSARLVEMETLFRRFHREIESHLKKEEAVLFPLIERLEESAAEGRPASRQSFGPLSNPVEFMKQDHELADRLLEKLKALCAEAEQGGEAGAIPQALCERFEAVEADLAVHVHLEDDILFPRAIRLEERALEERAEEPSPL